MKISIRWALIMGCLGLIWITQVVITTSTFISSQHILLRHARDIMVNIADLTKEQTKHYLSLAQGAAHLTKRLIASNVVGSESERLELLEKYFFDQLAIYPHFAGIYIGMPNGDFFYVSRNAQRSPEGLRTKIIQHHASLRETRLVWRDKDLRLIAQELDPSDTYDPRLRPWYQRASKENKIVWTDPYIFYTSQKPGITIAGPILDDAGVLRAVVGVDIEIDELSTFIGKLRIGKNGSAFMLNNNKDVVAFPDLSKLKFASGKKDQNLRLVKIGELEDPLVLKAFKAINWQQDDQARLLLRNSQFAQFEHKGQVYHAMFTPFLSDAWPWIIGVYLPEDDYLGSLKANRRLNIWITVAISVIATAIGLLLARGIIRPIVNLQNEACAITINDLEGHFDTNSTYTEIQATADAFSRMKEALRTSKDKYQSIFENIQDVYYETSIDGTIMEVSPSIRNISVYQREEIIGKSVYDLYVRSEDREKLMDAFINHSRVNDYEIILCDKDGSQRYCAINSVMIKDRAGAPKKIIGSIRNIDDRKRADMQLQQYRDHLEDLVRERTCDLTCANENLKNEIVQRQATEAALRKSEEKYRSIIENVQNGYFETDIAGNFTFVNEAMCRILGYAKSELITMNNRKFMDSENAQKVYQVFNSIYETGQPERLSHYEVIRKDGTRRILETSASLISNEEGRPEGFRGIVLDVSNRLQAEKERKRLEAQFQRIQRLEGIGTLAGGVAHDFNNLLMGIQGNASLMLLDLDETSPHYEKLKTIEKLVSGGADLTKQLLGFARGGKYVVQPTDLNALVENTTRMFARTRKEITIETQLVQNIWTVEADQNQIEQVLLNLYINGWQAMPEGGSLHVATRNTTLDRRFVKPFKMQHGKYVMISVKDTGSGMEEAIQHRVFEPFFTTKEMGRGTGLGLASAFGIIKNHDGIIDFSSKPGAGTTFFIYLPATGTKITENAGSVETPTKGSESILLIDDENRILDVIEPMLKSLGYRVLVAQSGKEAIRVFGEHKDLIDLVILDMIIPDLSGGAVYDQIKSIKPDIRVLLSSGYSMSGEALAIIDRGCNGFIQKPYDINRLSKKIRNLLDIQPSL